MIGVKFFLKLEWIGNQRGGRILKEAQFYNLGFLLEGEKFWYFSEK